MANKILLIEDDSGITMALTDLLNAEDYRVETAADGLTGLTRACEGDFDQKDIVCHRRKKKAPGVRCQSEFLEQELADRINMIYKMKLKT